MKNEELIVNGSFYELNQQRINAPDTDTPITSYYEDIPKAVQTETPTSEILEMLPQDTSNRMPEN